MDEKENGPLGENQEETRQSAELAEEPLLLKKKSPRTHLVLFYEKLVSNHTADRLALIRAMDSLRSTLDHTIGEMNRDNRYYPSSTLLIRSIGDHINQLCRELEDRGREMKELEIILREMEIEEKEKFT